MSTKFTASNGLEIEITEIGGIFAKSGYGHIQAGPGGTKALREFFQHERDRELGRWRDPVNPNLVMYLMPKDENSADRAVRVMDETIGYEYVYGENNRTWWEDSEGRAAAERYFEAHPESKPWDEAEPGEVWELTDAEGREQLWVWDEIDGWRSVHSDKVSHLVGREATAGRRIWPQED